MPPQCTGPVRTRTRVSNACPRCRRHKIKCSGSLPCKNCADKEIPCGLALDRVPNSRVVNHTEGTRAVAAFNNHIRLSQQTNLTVPQIQDVLQPAGEPYVEDDTSMVPSNDSADKILPFSTGEGGLSGGHDLNEDRDHCPPKIPNPMVPERPRYMADGYGNPRYLGHSSTFSFSRQLLNIVDQDLNLGNPEPSPLSFDAETYAVDINAKPLTPDDFTGLPSRELALFYIQVLKLKTSPLFYLFHEASFVTELESFYHHLLDRTCINRIWYVHYLLVMAFGKALSEDVEYGLVPGIKFFNRALRLLPDVTVLWRNLFSSVEIMCCIGLFLFSLDHRSAGYVYIGQALRMAQVEGLHTNIQDEHVGNTFATRGRQIWWTVYGLDRRVSTSLGVPNSLHDEDISAPFPSTTDMSITLEGQALHTHICQLLGKIVRTVYSIDGTLSKNFLITSQEVLRSIGGLADNLAEFSGRCLGDVSRVVAHLNLAYHQCIILCTRPFLLHLIKLRLDRTVPTTPLLLSKTCKGIIQACIDSAIQIVICLSSLENHRLLDTFIPFDLECCFSAGLVLTATAGIHPKLLPQKDWLGDIVRVLDYMIGKGNVLASVKKSEIQKLAGVRWDSRSESRPNIDTSHSYTDSTQTTPPIEDLPILGDPFFEEWGIYDGLSGAQLVSLADSLNIPGNSSLLSFY